jgi:hypothetical protein
VTAPPHDLADPAVRSIQIAAALARRYSELVTADDKTGAAFKNLYRLTGIGGLSALGREIQQDEQALRVGEANQIAPEIWRHLDDARTILAGRALPVAEYDSIRAGNLQTANPDVKRTLEALGLLDGDQQVMTTKTLQWDMVGAVRQIAAIGVLKRTLKFVDWDALDRADAEQIAAAGSLKSNRWRNLAWATAGIVVVAGLAFGAYFLVGKETPPADPEPATMTPEAKATAIEKARARLPELQRAHDFAPCDEVAMKRYTSYLYLAGEEQLSWEVEGRYNRNCKADAALEP